MRAGSMLMANLLVEYWRTRYSDELVATMPQQQQEYETGGIVGIATVVDVVTYSESPWFLGRYSWVLKEAHPMPFVAYRGQLGLIERSCGGIASRVCSRGGGSANRQDGAPCCEAVLREKLERLGVLLQDEVLLGL